MRTGLAQPEDNLVSEKLITNPPSSSGTPSIALTKEPVFGIRYRGVCGKSNFIDCPVSQKNTLVASLEVSLGIPNGENSGNHIILIGTVPFRVIFKVCYGDCPSVIFDDLGQSGDRRIVRLALQQIYRLRTFHSQAQRGGGVSEDGTETHYQHRHKNIHPHDLWFLGYKYNSFIVNMQSPGTNLRTL
jgi:hypothetical protein